MITQRGGQRNGASPSRRLLLPPGLGPRSRPASAPVHASFGPARPEPPAPAWRLCFAFVAEQLLVSANILIMFGCVRSEAEVALWVILGPLSMEQTVTAFCPAGCSANPPSPRQIGSCPGCVVP